MGDRSLSILSSKSGVKHQDIAPKRNKTEKLSAFKREPRATMLYKCYASPMQMLCYAIPLQGLYKCYASARNKTRGKYMSLKTKTFPCTVQNSSPTFVPRLRYFRHFLPIRSLFFGCFNEMQWILFHYLQV